jgi:translation initiation factor 1
MSKKINFSGGLVYSTNPNSLQPEEVEEEETLSKEKQSLKVRLDSKQRGGKVVTLIEGFIGKSEDLETLGKWLKTKCGTGGAAKDGQILIQGDCKQKVTLFLQQAGYKVKTL